MVTSEWRGNPVALRTATESSACCGREPGSCRYLSMWGEPCGRAKGGACGSKTGRAWYFGVGHGGKCIAIGAAKESSACCGVNLGARILGLGVGSKMGPDTVRRFQGEGKIYCGWGGKSVCCLLWGEPGRTHFGVGCRFQNGPGTVLRS